MLTSQTFKCMFSKKIKRLQNITESLEINYVIT